MSKHVRFDGIEVGSQQPYTKTTHQWYNDMNSEGSLALISSIIPSSWLTGKLVILSGCVFTGTNPGTRSITEGWVFYNGEIFKVDATAFTTTGSQIGVWSINETNSSLTFSNGAIKSVHQEKKFKITNGASGSGLFDEDSIDVAIFTDGFTVKSNQLSNSVIIPIGDWNMDSDIQKNIDHTPYGVDFSKVVSLSVVVYGDVAFGGVFNPLVVTDGSGASTSEVGVYMNSTQIVVQRKSSGFFDSSNFDSIGYNRGWVVIGVIP